MENGKQRKGLKVDRKFQQDNSSTRPQRHSLIYFITVLFQSVLVPHQWQSSVSSCGPVGKRAQVKSHCRFQVATHQFVRAFSSAWHSLVALADLQIPSTSGNSLLLFGNVTQLCSLLLFAPSVFIKALKGEPCYIFQCPEFSSFFPLATWCCQKLCCLLGPFQCAWSPDLYPAGQTTIRKWPLGKLRLTNSPL